MSLNPFTESIPWVQDLLPVANFDPPIYCRLPLSLHKCFSLLRIHFVVGKRGFWYCAVPYFNHAVRSVEVSRHIVSSLGHEPLQPLIASFWRGMVGPILLCSNGARHLGSICPETMQTWTEAPFPDIFEQTQVLTLDSLADLWESSPMRGWFWCKVEAQTPHAHEMVDGSNSLPQILSYVDIKIAGVASNRTPQCPKSYE